jgi:Fe-S-cluster containining protein
MNDQQHRKEEEISTQLCEAESAAARDILARTLTPIGLHEVIENASAFADAMTRRLCHPNTPPVACKEGCYWCCYQSVPVSTLEAFRIARFLSSEAMEDTRLDLIDRLRKLDSRTRGRAPSARANLHLPCAFLRDDRCTIYAVRPLACAEFTSFDVQDCRRGQRSGFKPGSVIHEKARMLVYRAVQEGLFDGLRQALPMADAAPLELTAAVMTALGRPDSEASWISGSHIFAEARLTVDPG